MDTLKPIIFLFPIIALILVRLLYVFSLKRVPNKKAFKEFVWAMVVLAFLLNLAWELRQMPLYDRASFGINHVLFCALGSVADTIMVLLLYFTFTIIFKNTLWIYPLKWQWIVVVVLTGGIGAVLSEMRHLSLGNWAYSDMMPLIPIFNVGLSPVLQFMILPVLIYILSLSWKIKKLLIY
jgi:hypothetical protein